MGVHSESALSEAYNLIENGAPSQAKLLLEDALTADLDNDILVFAIHCCSFWADTFSGSENLSPFEKGEMLVNKWKKFRMLVNKEKEPDEQTVYAFRKGIFTYALSQFMASSSEKDAALNCEIFRKAGLCHKRLGNYQAALECLNKANSIMPSQAAVLAELADCYDLCGEQKFAKLMFREAFFTDAQKVELANLDSPLIHSLEEKVEQEGYSGEEVLEWIPIYGIFLDVLNIKRPLRAQEAGRLKQDIYARENELKNPANNSKIIKPRLITMYLRLIDHYILTKENIKRIKEITLKIKLLDPELYKKFVE